MMPNVAPFHFYINAFQELGTARQLSNGIGPIPFGAIVEYHKIYGEDEDFDDFLYLMRAMDNELLGQEETKYKKQESEQKKKNQRKSLRK